MRLDKADLEIKHENLISSKVPHYTHFSDLQFSSQTPVEWPCMMNYDTKKCQVASSHDATSSEHIKISFSCSLITNIITNSLFKAPVTSHKLEIKIASSVNLSAF